MQIIFFSSSKFTIPIMDSILCCEDTIVNKFIKQYDTFISDFDFTKFKKSIFPHKFYDRNYIFSLLSKIDDSNVSLKGIVSTSEKVNRGKKVVNPVLEYARSKNIPNLSPHNLNKEFENTSSFMSGVDVSILASYGQIISDEILNLPRLGFINWHPSALPKYRGASPMHQVLKNGDKISSLTWLEMVKKMDAGNIWFQIPHCVDSELLYNELVDINVNIGVNTWTFPIIFKILSQMKNLDTL